ncbi:MAG: ABC transporter ATP-binding protein [Christensenellales bacterium]
MIEARGIYKSYLTEAGSLSALEDVNFILRDGGFAAIMGPSGSGKTTLLNILGCLDKPDTGEYILAGSSVSKLSRAKLAHLRNRTIGYVFQAFHLIPKLTALENVELPLIYGNVPITKRKSRAMAMLEKMGVADRASHLPSQLSGGQKQRVAIARALVNDPALILADEPTGNLDEDTGKDIMETLSYLNKCGCSIALITHSCATASYAKEKYILRGGRLMRRD